MTNNNTLLAGTIKTFRSLNYQFVLRYEKTGVYVNSINLLLNGKRIRKIIPSQTNLLYTAENEENIVLSEILKNLSDTEKPQKPKIKKKSRYEAAHDIMNMFNI